MDRRARRSLGRRHDRLAHRLVGAGHTFDDEIDLFAAIADELKKRALALRADRRGAVPDPRPCAAAWPEWPTSSASRCSATACAPISRAKLFPGSAALLALADELVELKAVCECGRKATMNLRVDAEGHAVAEGAQTEIGGNDRYIALCRKHFFERLNESRARQLSLALPRT